MSEGLINKAREGLSQMVPGSLVQMHTRNDLTPATTDLIEWAKTLVEEHRGAVLDKERERRERFQIELEAQSGKMFLDSVFKVYQSLSEGMVLKNKEQEHELALRKTKDVVAVAIEARDALYYESER